MTSPWAIFAEMELALRAPGNPAGTHRGAGWFAALSGQDHAELNVCGLAPDATVASAEELQAYVAERVASYKQIRLLTFIDVVPKSASGKILRRVLRDTAPAD